MAKTPTGDDLPLKVKPAVYGAGLFSNSISNMMNIVVPLWALTLDPTPLTLGLVLGARRAARGATMGMSQPLMISIMSKSSGTRQGRAVGLRTTTNRLVTVVVPIAMGGLVEILGLEMAFYIIGIATARLRAGPTAGARPPFPRCPRPSPRGRWR